MGNSLRPNPQDVGVRPFFRVPGALFTGFLAYFYLATAIPLFSVKHLAPRICSQRRIVARLLCQFEQDLLNGLPDEMQGPLEAVGRILFALAWVYATWWLLKPLLTRRR
jgi:hypothetical protein